MYSYDDLYIFMKIIDNGNFSNASKTLNISHSTLSRRIQKLENELGTMLIYRNNHTFEITSIGRQLYYELKNCTIEQLDTAIGKIVENQDDMSGKLRVVLPTTISLDWITPYLPLFLEKYPNIRLEISYQHEEVDLIGNGINIAVTSVMPKQQTMKIKHVYTTNCVLCCTEQYQQTYGIPSSIDELKQHLVTGLMDNDFIVPKYVKMFDDERHEELTSSASSRMFINNALHTLALLKTHRVIGAIFDYMIDTLTQENTTVKILRVMPRYSFFSVRVYIVFHPHKRDPLVKLFSEFIEHCFRKTVVEWLAK